VWPLVGDLLSGANQKDPFFGFAKPTSEAGIGLATPDVDSKNAARRCSSIDDGAGLLFE
jgi:hypothetical protein